MRVRRKFMKMLRIYEWKKWGLVCKMCEFVKRGWGVNNQGREGGKVVWRNK